MPQGYKTGGRQKGTPNKVSSKTKETISLLVESLSEDILSSLPTLTTEEKLSLLPRLLPFILPRPQETQEDTKPKSLVIIGGKAIEGVNIKPIEWVSDEGQSLK